MRELVGARTAESQTFLLASGERLVKLYANPEFYRPAGSPTLQRIHTELRRRAMATNSLSSTGNSWTATLNPSNGSSGMVQVALASSQVSMSPINAASVAPTQASGASRQNSATYSNLWPGVDAQYSITTSGIKENLVVRRSTADPTFDFSIQGASVTPDPATGGATLSVAGKDVASIPALTVSSASGSVAGANPTLSVLPGPNGAIVQVSVNSLWLEQLPQADFPVVIDPTLIENPGTTDSAFSVESVPNTASGSGTPVPGVLKVGYSPSTATQWAAAVHWNYETYLNSNPQYQVMNAYVPVGVFVDQSGGCGCTTSLSAYPIIGGTASNPTYSNLVGSSSSLLSQATDSGVISQAMGLQSAYTSWFATNQSAMGIAFDGTINGSTNTLKVYGANPEIDLVVEQPPPAEQLSAPLTGAVVATTTPTLVAPQEGPDDGSTVVYDFIISTNLDGSGQVLDSGWNGSISFSGGNVNYTPPKGVLQDGVTYYAKMVTSILPGTMIPIQPTMTQFKVNLRLGGGGQSPTDSVGTLPGGSPTPSAGSPSPQTPPASVTVNMVDGNLALGVGGHSLSTVAGPLNISLAYNSLSQNGASTNKSGLTGQYYSDSGTHVIAPANLIGQRTDPSLNFNWTTAPPVGGVVSGSQFLAQWTGYVNVPAAQVGTGCSGSGSGDCWSFGVASDGGMEVWLDGNTRPVVNTWSNGSVNAVTPAFSYGSVALTAGVHQISVQAWEPSGGYQVAQVSMHDSSVPSSGTTVGLAGWLSSTPLMLPSGWTMTPGGGGVQFINLNDQGGTVAVLQSDGSSLDFTETSGGAYQPPPGNQDLLTAINGGYSLATPNNQLYQFNPNGTLTSVTSTADDLTPSSPIYAYGGSPAVLQAITDPASGTTPASGRKVTLDYGGATNSVDGSTCPSVPSGFFVPTGMLCAINYWDSAHTTFLYDSFGRLVKVINPGDEVAQFGYDSTSGYLNQILDPLGYDAVAAGVAPNTSVSDTNITYALGSTGSYQVQTVTSPQAVPGSSVPAPQRTYTYFPNASPAYTLVNVAGFSPTIGYSEKVTYDSKGEVIAKSQATGATTTAASSTIWDGNGLPVVSVNDAGLQSTTVYDLTGLPTDTYGPSPTACFTVASPYRPVANPMTTPGCGIASVPHATKSYDDNMTMLAASYWPNQNMLGPVELHGTGPVDTSGDLKATGADFPAGIPSTSWSAQYTGTISLTSTAGSGFTYGFEIETHQKASLFVNDILVASATGTPTGGQGTFVSGSVPSGTVGPVPIRINYSSNSATGSKNGFNVKWIQPGASTWKPVLDTSLDPNYGLLTTATDPDGVVTTTSYSDNGPGGDGIAPQYGLPTAVTKYPNGILEPASQDLTTTTTYETPSSSTFLRRTATTLPAGDPTPGLPADGATSDQTTFSYYGNTAGPLAVACGVTSATVQGGLESQKTDPAPAAGSPSIVTQFIYDSAGDLVGTRSGTSNEISTLPWNCTSYDARGRILSQSYAAHNGAPARMITYNYSVSGNPLTSNVTDGTTTISSVVDLLGRATSYNDNGISTATSYNQAGQTTSTTGPQGTLSDTYDPNSGQLATVALNGATEATNSYDPTSGRLTGVSYANATNLAIGYDSLGAESSLVFNGPAGVMVAGDTVTRSSGARITTEMTDTSAGLVNLNPGGGADYTYDGAGRLIQSYGVNHSIGYNYGANLAGCANPNQGADTNVSATTTTPYAAGSAVIQNYCYDLSDQLVSEASTTGGINSNAFTYDDLGNSTGLVGSTLGWNASGQNIRISSAGNATINYTIDPLDRLLTRTEGSSAINYSYCGLDSSACATVNASGATIEGFVPLPGGVLLTTAAGGTIWSYPNIRGDMIVTAGSSGLITSGPYSYSPFGAQDPTGSPIQNVGAAISLGAFGEAGILTETGNAASNTAIIQMGARPYAPSLGRFLGIDPVEGGCANAYVYVFGDPVNHADVTGQSSCGGGGFWGNVWGDILGLVSAGAAVVSMVFIPEEAIGAAFVVGGIALAAGTVAAALDWGHCLHGDAGACAGAILGSAGSGLGGADLAFGGLAPAFERGAAGAALKAAGAKLGLAGLTVDGTQIYKKPEHC